MTLNINKLKHLWEMRNNTLSKNTEIEERFRKIYEIAQYFDGLNNISCGASINAALMKSNWDYNKNYLLKIFDDDQKKYFNSIVYLVNLNNKNEIFRISSEATDIKWESKNTAVKKGIAVNYESHLPTHNHPNNIVLWYKNKINQNSAQDITLIDNQGDSIVFAGDKTNGQHRFVFKYLWMLANRKKCVPILSLKSYYNLEEVVRELHKKGKITFHIDNFFPNNGHWAQKLNDFIDNWPSISNALAKAITGKEYSGVTGVLSDNERTQFALLLFLASLTEKSTSKIALDMLKTGNRAMIMYGPPGTGKTYLAKKVAEELFTEESQPGQIQALNVSGLSSTQVVALTASQINQLTLEQVKSLNTDIVPHLTSCQIGALTTAQVSALSENLTTRQLRALTTTQIQALQIGDLSTTQLGTLSTEAMAVLSGEQARSLTTDQIQSLTTAQSRMLTIEAVARLSTCQIAALRMDAPAALTQAQIAVLDTAQIEALSTAQKLALTTTQICALNTTDQIAALSTTDIAGLTTLDIGMLTTSQVPALTTAHIQALNTEQIQALSFDQIESLTADQVQALTTKQIGVLSTQTITCAKDENSRKSENDIDKMRFSKLEEKAKEGKGSPFIYILSTQPKPQGKTANASIEMGNMPGAWELIQFHPSYSYYDFIGGIMPKIGENEKGIEYELKHGIFKRFCECASNNLNKSFVFIIDEINRAELSAVFGELLYAIEYRDESVNVPHFGSFTIPKNVYIIGTMNTVDRSLSAFDFALRRRFLFFKCDPDMSVLHDWNKERKTKLKTNIDDTDLETLINKANTLNENLSSNKKSGESNNLGLPNDYKIGHAYFMKIVDFCDPGKDVKISEYSREQLWIYHIEPLLEEYLGSEYETKKDNLIKIRDEFIKT